MGRKRDLGLLSPHLHPCWVWGMGTFCSKRCEIELGLGERRGEGAERVGVGVMGGEESVTSRQQPWMPGM